MVPDGFDQLLATGLYTQKLCVRFCSIDAVLGSGGHGGHHFPFGTV
jgi:hypothetical protein